MKILSFIEDPDVTRLPRLVSALNGMSGGVSRNYAECWNLLGDGNGGQVKKILKHLDVWDIKARHPPKRANAPPPEIHTEYSHSQVPLCEDHLYCDPDYPIEAYASRRSRFWRG